MSNNEDNSESTDIMNRFIRGDLRRRRPPLRRSLLLPLYQNPFNSEEEDNDRRELITNLRRRYTDVNIEEDINSINSIFDKYKKEKKELEKYKNNYERLMKYIPSIVSKDIIKNNKCAICLDDKINFEEVYYITSCFHIFHEKCIKEAQNFNKRCPICRTDLRSSYYKKVKLSLDDRGVDEF